MAERRSCVPIRSRQSEWRGEPGVNSIALARSPKAAGLAMLAAMLLAFALANSPARDWYQVVHHLPVMVQVGSLTIDKPMILWINDGLMMFFFLLIALELKREILEGQLTTFKTIATPAFAAVGGMAAPALIFARSTPAIRWPCAAGRSRLRRIPCWP